MQAVSCCLLAAKLTPLWTALSYDATFTVMATCSDASLQVENWKDGKLVSVEEVTESEEEAPADAEDGEWDEDEQVLSQCPPELVWHNLNHF